MLKLRFAIVIAALAPVASIATAAEYEIPPSSTTHNNVPYISDEAMKACVKIYNEAKWLSEEIGRTSVDEYSQASVDAYNAKVGQHAGMIDSFNRDCAGKQSESAYRAAQELNKQQAGGVALPAP